MIGCGCLLGGTTAVGADSAPGRHVGARGDLFDSAVGIHCTEYGHHQKRQLGKCWKVNDETASRQSVVGANWPLLDLSTGNIFRQDDQLLEPDYIAPCSAP